MNQRPTGPLEAPRNHGAAFPTCQPYKVLALATYLPQIRAEGSRGKRRALAPGCGDKGKEPSISPLHPGDGAIPMLSGFSLGISILTLSTEVLGEPGQMKLSPHPEVLGGAFS